MTRPDAQEVYDTVRPPMNTARIGKGGFVATLTVGIRFGAPIIAGTRPATFIGADHRNVAYRTEEGTIQVSDWEEVGIPGYDWLAPVRSVRVAHAEDRVTHLLDAVLALPNAAWTEQDEGEGTVEGLADVLKVLTDRLLNACDELQKASEVAKEGTT